MYRDLKKNSAPSNRIEVQLRAQGYHSIAGVDEVGRGAWAGPLVMAAVVFGPTTRLPGLRDSKKLSATRREQLSPRIKKLARGWALGIVTVQELNAYGLGAGLQLAASRALGGLAEPADFVLFDGNHRLRGLSSPQQVIVKGDQTVRAIAAASVLAKVARDAMMTELHSREPDLAPFRFDLNKGYPSPVHKQALAHHGPTQHHRRTFAPVQAAGNQKLF